MECLKADPWNIMDRLTVSTSYLHPKDIRNNVDRYIHDLDEFTKTYTPDARYFSGSISILLSL
jgi:hypothetical protein